MSHLPNPNNEMALRAILAADLGRSIDDDTWQKLETDGSLGRYANGPTHESYEKLRRQAARYSRGEPGRRPGKRTRQVLDQVLEPLEELRSQVVSRHMARLAAHRDSVVLLRQRLFNGSVLPSSDAENLLHQVGPKYFELEWFNAQGIPLVGHKSFYFDPKCGQDPLGWMFNWPIRFEWNGGVKEVPGSRELEHEAQSGAQLRLHWGQLCVRRSSVLGLIQEVASELSFVYGWPEARAVMFLLTGEPPREPSISAVIKTIWGDDHTHIKIEMQFAPWVSPESVMRAVHQLHRTMPVRQVRHRGDRALMLFDFVEERRERLHGRTPKDLAKGGLDLTWQKLANEWNEKHRNEPQWRYENSSRMRADFLRTWRALVWPSGVVPSKVVKEMHERSSRPPSV